MVVGWGGVAGCTGMESEGSNLLSLVDGGSEWQNQVGAGGEKKLMDAGTDSLSCFCPAPHPHPDPQVPPRPQGSKPGLDSAFYSICQSNLSSMIVRLGAPLGSPMNILQNHSLPTLACLAGPTPLRPLPTCARTPCSLQPPHLSLAPDSGPHSPSRVGD